MLDPEDQAVSLEGTQYEIHFYDRSMLRGALDANNKGKHKNVSESGVKKILYKPRPGDKEKPIPPLNDLLGL